MQMKNIFLSLLLAIMSWGCNQMASAQKEDKPNVIIIYADDLGRGILGKYGQTKIATPNLDKLALQGKTFTNAYGSNVCAPARASLLTGLNNAKAPVHTPGGLVCELEAGIIDQATFDKKIYRSHNQGYYYIGEMAKSAGYHTSYIGKLGFGYSDTKEMIDSYGFDYHCGLYDAVLCWSFYPPHYRLNGKKIPIPNNPKLSKREPVCPLVGEENMTYSEDIWLEHALSYLEEKKDDPFFMIYATQLPHGPASIAPKDFKYKDQEGWTKQERVYASMINKLDESVGAIITKLEELKIADNTVIIFTSDNGHEIQSYTTVNPQYKDPDIVYDYESNSFDQSKVKPNKEQMYWDGHHSGEDIFNGAIGRRGMKRYNFEGGLNVPYIVKWPGKVMPNSESNLMIADYDIMATVSDIIGGEVKPNDGISILPTFLDQEDQKEHDYIFFKCTTGSAQDVIIKDGWKLINELDTKNSDYKLKNKAYHWALYNLNDDPFEKQDLASQFPEKVKEFKRLIDKENNAKVLYK